MPSRGGKRTQTSSSNQLINRVRHQNAEVNGAAHAGVLFVWLRDESKTQGGIASYPAS